MSLTDRVCNPILKSLIMSAEAAAELIPAGASTAPELDGALAKVDGIEMRLPYQSDPTVRSMSGSAFSVISMWP